MVFGLGRRRQVAELHRSIEVLRSSVRAEYVTLDERWGRVMSDALVARSGLAADDGYVLQLEGERQQAADAMQGLTHLYLDAEHRHDPAGHDDVEPLQQARAGWAALAQRVQDAAKEIADVEQAVADIEDARARCHHLVSTLPQLLADTETSISRAAEEGYDVGSLRLDVERAAGDLVLGRGSHQSHRLWEAAAALGRAEQTITRTLDAARGLPHRRSALLARHAELARRASSAEVAIQRITEVLRRIQSGFVHSVWEPVEDSPAEATELLAIARRGLADAEEASTMDAQRFGDADRHLDTAAQHLDLLDRVAGEVAAFERDLQALVAEYPRAHAAARASLEQARRFVASHPTDVNPSHRPNLDRAGQVLADAERMAADGSGDPNIAIQRLREVVSYTDAVLYTARSEKQKVDAYRNLAAQIVRDADRTLSHASLKAGLGLFGWSARARQSLQIARSEVEEARSLVATDPARAEWLAAKAHQTAQQIIYVARQRAAYRR